jgi:hypothetical protein
MALDHRANLSLSRISSKFYDLLELVNHKPHSPSRRLRLGKRFQSVESFDQQVHTACSSNPETTLTLAVHVLSERLKSSSGRKREKNFLICSPARPFQRLTFAPG